MVCAGERRKVAPTALDRHPATFPWTYLAGAFQQADLAASCGFIEWYSDWPGWGLACWTLSYLPDEEKRWETFSNLQTNVCPKTKRFSECPGHSLQSDHKLSAQVRTFCWLITNKSFFLCSLTFNHSCTENNSQTVCVFSRFSGCQTLSLAPTLLFRQECRSCAECIQMAELLWTVRTIHSVPQWRTETQSTRTKLHTCKCVCVYDFNQGISPNNSIFCLPRLPGNTF